MMQNYGFTAKLLSDHELLNQVFTFPPSFISSEQVHTFIFHFASLLVVMQQKRVKVKRRKMIKKIST
jgi:hypothetical protein